MAQVLPTPWNQLASSEGTPCESEQACRYKFHWALGQDHLEVLPRSTHFIERRGIVGQGVENGQVRYGGPERVKVSGEVTSTGDIRGSVGHGPAQANVMGRLAESSGSGTWAGSGSLRCSGQWRAEKQA